MTSATNKNIIVASESPQLYTTKRLISEAEKLKCSTIWLNPYQHLLRYDHNHPVMPLNDRSCLYFHRTTGIRYDNYDLSVAEFHEMNRHKITNPIQALEIFRDKDRQSLFLNRHKLSSIETINYRGELNEKHWDAICSLSSNQQYIIKMNRGNQGIGVNLVNGIQSLKSLLETFHAMKDQKFIIQPFIKHKKEWRIFVIKNKIISILERTVGEDEFRGNSKRSKAKCIKKINSEIEAEILRAVELSGLDYCGVDIISDSNKYYFLEINAVPGFEQLEELSGINIARELIVQI